MLILERFLNSLFVFLDHKWVNRRVEGYFLVHSRDHACHDQILFAEVQQLNALEALVQMILHSDWVLGLGQDVQQVVIGQEKEAREEQLLRVQVLVQLFLHVINRFVAAAQVLEDAVLAAGIKD